MTDGTQHTLIQERRHLIRSGLAEILDRDPRICVVGAVVDAAELAAACADVRPDAVVLELEAPWDSQVLAHQLRVVAPGVRLVALHEGRSDDHARRAAQVGVDALAPYGAGTVSIIAGVLAEPVLVEETDERREPKSRATLTPRELQVLRHLADGSTAAECAAALHVSRKTVDNHKQRIFSKLKVQNQAHAVALAHRMGVLGSSSGYTGAHQVDRALERVGGNEPPAAV